MLRLALWLILIALALWGASVVAVKAQSIGGIECATIRRLTAIEKRYWTWRLGLSQEQVDQIRKVCRLK